MMKNNFFFRSTHVMRGQIEKKLKVVQIIYNMKCLFEKFKSPFKGFFFVQMGINPM